VTAEMTPDATRAPIADEDSPLAVVTPREAGPGRVLVRRILRSKTNVACIVFLTFLTFIAIFAGALSPHGPREQDLLNSFAPPLSPGHVLGTDQFGRDLLSRLMYAARISLIAPLIAVGVGTAIGLPLGLLAGYLGGKLDWVLGRIADALIALPSLVLALAIIGVLGPSLVNAMLAVGIAYAPRLFRVVRGATLGVREETFIEASRVAGCSTPRLIFAHVLPNIRSPLLVQLTLMMGLALIAEASLSFLGLGVQPPDASWGVMLREAFENNFSGPWLVVPPGVAIVLTVLSFNLLGDGIRDAVGQQRRGSR
jgi:peptide/nickel transport system permease protein